MNTLSVVVDCRMKFTRRWSVTIGIVCILALSGAFVVWYAVENVLPYSPIRPHRMSRDEIRIAMPGVTDPSSLGLMYDTLTVYTADSLLLQGWFIHAAMEPSRGTILLLHGIGTSRFSMLDHARQLASEGFNSVLYDSRANGESGGINCTFGYYEKHDVVRVIDEVMRRFPECGPIGIYGHSLGAAVSVQAMAIDPRIRCGVIESPFATLREVIHDFARAMFFIPIDGLSDAALRRSEQIAHFVVDSVVPEASARKIRVPVLVAHGTADERITIAYGRRVYDALASDTKVWRGIVGGAHNDLAAVGGEAYAREVLAFFKSHLSRDERRAR